MQIRNGKLTTRSNRLRPRAAGMQEPKGAFASRRLCLRQANARAGKRLRRGSCTLVGSLRPPQASWQAFSRASRQATARQARRLPRGARLHASGAGLVPLIATASQRRTARGLLFKTSKSQVRAASRLSAALCCKPRLTLRGHAIGSEFCRSMICPLLLKPNYDNVNTKPRAQIYDITK